MKKRHLLSTFSLAGLILMGIGCQRKPSIPAPIITNPPEATSTAATILISAEASTNYCNGADMDSNGYRKTITGLRTTALPNYTNETQRVKFILLAATSGMCRQVLENSELTIKNGELHIPPLDGWAGMSITMCSCKPQVEVNALRIPGITRVVWE